MENRITTGTILALVCCAALAFAAQRPTPHVGSAPVARPSVIGTQTDSKETSTATVTGCVQPGAGPKTYVLAESPSALAPAGAPTQPAATRDRGTRYELLSDGTIDLSKLIGRQVEASGTVSKPAVSANDHKATTRADALPKFSVKSLRETGASC
ncbi:MAG TPA: hypothetical protein VGQ37_06520 [Vicinamibacterales bacterium]|jgi:hypothetical protein|nr:hypothetical protein [Vicinamibacterales bacterium]